MLINYFDENIKNANQIKIPNSIENIDDWRKFYISTVVLFDEFSENISNPDEKWAKKSLSKNDYKDSLQSLHKVLEKVR
jgi:hypothetical protein